MSSTSFLMQTATVAAVLCLTFMSYVEAFSPAFVRPSSLTASTTSLSASPVSRQDFVKTLLVASSAGAVGLSPWTASAEETKTLDNGVKVVVNQAGDGPQPDIGELAAIRFRAFFGSTKIDDIFDTPEPYYTRIGNGGMLKGVEQTLPLMRTGDRWTLTIPGELAFGAKGRPASAGKPRIPANAEITFEVEMVGVPGKEPELIDLIGDV